ncbi:riboflavin kinase, partial [Homo sapiens]
RGFGRGSKQLGIPTANFPEQVVDNLPADISTGIYYGWASVGSGDVHKMVVSIGWNPYYKNTKKSMETHIMHTFKEDFYGEILNVAIVGYLRPEKNFDSLAGWLLLSSGMKLMKSFKMCEV